MSEINDKNYAIYKFRQNIYNKSLKLFSCILNQNAYNYFRFGYIIRLSNIIVSRDELFQLLKKDAGEYFDTTFHTLYINSIYVNIFGALDNLAWVLHHEFNLVKGVTEKKNRKKVGLFSEEWINALKQKDEKIVEDISTFKKWYEECKDFRDLAAHRMPLYCQPGIQFGEDKPEDVLLEKKLDTMSVNDKSYMDTHLKVNAKGIYKSWFCVNSEEDKTFYFLDRVVFDDYKAFLELSGLIIKLIEKRV